MKTSYLDMSETTDSTKQHTYFVLFVFFWGGDYQQTFSVSPIDKYISNNFLIKG